MSKKTTLERAYYHINNGGLTFSIIERVDVRKDCTVFPEDWPQQIRGVSNEERETIVAALPHEERHNRRWTFEVETRHFGSGVTFKFPIVPVIVRWTIDALQRVLERMEAPQELPTDGYEHALQDQSRVTVTTRGGLAIEREGWPTPHTPCVSDSSG